MSELKLKGRVGPWEVCFESVPVGAKGTAMVLLKRDGNGERRIEVCWERLGPALRLELPHGVYCFDFSAKLDDDGRRLYDVSRRGSAEKWSDVLFLRAGEEAGSGGAAGVKKKGPRVRAQMPGKIVRVLVEAGAQVEKNQPLMVMEAMKMENEIRAPIEGKIAKLLVVPGQAVETGADLLLLELIS